MLMPTGARNLSPLTLRNEVEELLATFSFPSAVAQAGATSFPCASRILGIMFLV